MKKYNLENLTVLTIQNNENILHNKTKIICERHFIKFTQEIYWKEIFTGEKFTIDDQLKKYFDDEPFKYYFPDLIKRGKGYKFSKFELFTYYNELNKIELLSNTDEKDIENYLTDKKRFKYSKLYEKRYRQ